jgi:hypothetical protein
MTTFTRTWNAAYEAIPADTDDASGGALRIRNLKEDIGERLEVDHSWLGDADDGAHKKLTLIEQGADPGSVANRGFLYTKDVAGVTELYYRDSGGTVTQLTAGGVISGAALLAAANTFTGVNTIRSTDGGTGEIVALDLDRASGSPANNDLLMALRWLMKDDGTNSEVAAKLVAKITDVSAASTDAELLLYTMVANVLTLGWHFGAGQYAEGATGGDKGAGSINAISLFVANIAVALQANGLTQQLALEAANDLVGYWDNSANAQRNVTVGRLGGLLEEQNLSGAASLIVNLSQYTGYKHFLLLLDDWVPGTDAVSADLTVSTDGGSGYDSSGYAYTSLGESSALISGIDNTAAFIRLNSASALLGNGANEQFSAAIFIYDPFSTSKNPRFKWEVVQYNSVPHITTYTGAGQRLADQDTTHVKIAPSAGTITGSARLYGMF